LFPGEWISVSHRKSSQLDYIAWSSGIYCGPAVKLLEKVGVRYQGHFR
jgi:hypothetical protein